MLLDFVLYVNILYGVAAIVNNVWGHIRFRWAESKLPHPCTLCVQGTRVYTSCGCAVCMYYEIGKSSS